MRLRSDKSVTVAGWAHRRRDHGGVIFVDLRDREGLLQIVFDPDKAEVFAMAERVRNEFVLKVTGLVRAPPAGHRQRAISSPGRSKCLCQELEILNRSEPLPFQLDETVSEEVRLALPVLGSAPRGDARAFAAAPSDHARDAPLSGRGGLRRHRNAHAIEGDAGRRPRLLGAEPHACRQILCVCRSRRRSTSNC